MDSKKLEQVHPGYSEYAYRWDYYMRSYMGAEEYRDGTYLRKYITEDHSPGNQYEQRLLDNCLQNQVKTVVDTYRSFLFRLPPTRTLGTAVDDPAVRNFIDNTDLDYTNLDHFMRKVADMITIYGGCWIGVDRPAYVANTAAEEIALDIRSYATLYSPTNVLDWQFSLMPNGRKELTYIKIIEESHADWDILRLWYPDRVLKIRVAKAEMLQSVMNVTQSNTIIKNYGEILEYDEYVNPLGYLPFQHVYETESFYRGIGTSDVGDVADIQRYNYNLISEAIQNIRISSHPSIVAQPDAELNGGVGAIIYVDEQTQIQPYLLQPTGASIESILKVMEQNISAIDDITHLSAVRAVTGQPMSGVALQVTRQNLNNKLAIKASVLQRAEIRMWKDFFAWQNMSMPEEFEVYYEKSFDMRDKHSDIELFRKALESVPHDSFQHYIHNEIARMMVDNEEDLQMILDSIAADHMEMNVEVPGEQE